VVRKLHDRKGAHSVDGEAAVVPHSSAVNSARTVSGDS
jgi:hypothetical protein